MTLWVSCVVFACPRRVRLTPYKDNSADIRDRQLRANFCRAHPQQKQRRTTVKLVSDLPDRA